MQTAAAADTLTENDNGSTTPVCGAGWEANNGRCYLKVTTPLPSDNQRNQCQQKGGMLMVIRSEEDNVSMCYELTKQSQHRHPRGTRPGGQYCGTFQISANSEQHFTRSRPTSLLHQCSAG